MMVALEVDGRQLAVRTSSRVLSRQISELFERPPTLLGIRLRHKEIQIRHHARLSVRKRLSEQKRGAFEQHRHDPHRIQSTGSLDDLLSKMLVSDLVESKYLEEVVTDLSRHKLHKASPAHRNPQRRRNELLVGDRNDATPIKIAGSRFETEF